MPCKAATTPSPRNSWRVLCYPKLWGATGPPPCALLALIAAAAVSALAIAVKGFAACAVVLPGAGLDGQVAQGFSSETVREEIQALRAEVRNSTAELRKLVLSRHAALLEELQRLHGLTRKAAVTKDELGEALARDRAEEMEALRRAVAAESAAADAARRQALVDAFREERLQEHADLVQMRHSLFNFTRAQSSQLKEILVEQLETLQSIKLRGAAGGKDKQAGLTRGIWSLLTSGDKDTVARPGSNLSGERGH